MTFGLRWLLFYNVEDIQQIMVSKVSVIIPYYNDGKYIAETLYSVNQQTYSNIEIILIDDGSDDTESIRIFDEIKLKDGIKLREVNAGPSVARNLGISHANGKYILPLDADDKIAPSYIEKAVEVLEKKPQCGIVYSKAAFFGVDGGRWNLPPFSMGKMLISNIIFNAGLFRKKDWEACGGYDESLKAGIEDWEFWLSILALKRDVYQINEVLFYYRIKKISRNQKFGKNQDLIRKTYFDIQAKHKDLYKNFFDEYLLASREWMLNQSFALQELQQKTIKARIGRMFPNLRKLKHILMTQTSHT